MDCEKIKIMLDAYIDGELSEAQERELAEHAKACEACREEFEAAKMLRDTLAHMDDDISVPLEAQAAWRGAVRAEAKKMNRRKWMRTAYAAAAVLAVVFGVSFFFSSVEPADVDMVAAKRSMPESVQLIQKDGAQEAVSGAADANQAYNVRKKIVAGDAEQAGKTLSMLAAEYSGCCTDSGDGIYRIELPYEYMQDYLKAAGSIGREAESYTQIVSEDPETAVILIQISAETE